MANVAGVGLDVGNLIDLLGNVGKFYLPIFVVNDNIFNAFLPSNVLDDFIDILPGIEHHGVVGAQFDGVSQPVDFHYQVINDALPLIFDVEVSPGGNTDEQYQTDQ